MILFTANRDIAAPLLELESMKEKDFLHLPLEKFRYRVFEEESKEVKENLSAITFIIHGNLRNARYFAEWIDNYSQQEAVRNSVNLVLDRPTASFLEEMEIPAILPCELAKPIDILEFMLRISKEGKTLYPTTEQKTEEMPGLLLELEMPVAEFTVCEEAALEEEELKEFRAKADIESIEAVLFHNRSSYVRTKTAFPDLDISSKTVISGSRGVSVMLLDDGINPDLEAQGSWASIARVLEKV